MARKTTATTVEAPKRPDFSLRMTDKDLYFGVEVYGNKLVVDGTNVSQIKNREDLNRYLHLVGEIVERIDLQDDYNSDISTCFDTCGSCDDTCTEGFCGPCYCAN